MTINRQCQSHSFDRSNYSLIAFLHSISWSKELNAIENENENNKMRTEIHRRTSNERDFTFVLNSREQNGIKCAFHFNFNSILHRIRCDAYVLNVNCLSTFAFFYSFPLCLFRLLTEIVLQFRNRNRFNWRDIFVSNFFFSFPVLRIQLSELIISHHFDCILLPKFRTFFISKKKKNHFSFSLQLCIVSFIVFNMQWFIWNAMHHMSSGSIFIWWKMSEQLPGWFLWW